MQDLWDVTPRKSRIGNMEPTEIVENHIDETQEIGIQEAPNKTFFDRLCLYYQEYLKDCAETANFKDMDSVPSFLEFIHKKLGNPTSL